MRAASLTLILVRHGLTDWNETGRLLGRTAVELNARGQAQARALAEALRELPLRAVLCSPQRRAQETAAPIADAHGLAIQTESGLDEVWLGRWQGKLFGELLDDPDLHRYFEDPTYVCDAVESTVSVQQRVVEVAERLRAEGAGETVALVSHGDPLRVLLAHYLSMAPSAYRRLTVSPGSASVLKLGRRGPRMLTVNWQPPGRLGALLS